jgi:hypothetical protein
MPITTRWAGYGMANVGGKGEREIATDRDVELRNVRRGLCSFGSRIFHEVRVHAVSTDGAAEPPYTPPACLSGAWRNVDERYEMSERNAWNHGG